MPPRPERTPKRQRAKAYPSKPKMPPASRPGVTILDPLTEKAVNSLFYGLLKRLAITTVVMIVVGLIVSAIAKFAHTPAAPVIFLSILLGVAIAYHRGVDTVFEGVRKIGIEKLAQKRYADALFALENFHRMGNMGRDRDGEAHYYLMQTYLATGETARAADIAQWLGKNRKRSPWAAKAAQENTSA